MREKLRLRRWPVLTLVVFAVTLAVNVAQVLRPGLLGDLERRPAGLHGDWWRSGSALLVQDGGAAGTVSNLAFLLIVGTAAEQVTGRWRWLTGYLGAAAVGEAAGYAWQPVGGGNSIAICGLAGIVALALFDRTAGRPAWAPVVLTWWCGALLATWWPPLIAVAVIATPLAAAKADWDDRVHRSIAIALVGLVAVVLGLARNIHGATLLAGLILAAAGVTATRPSRPRSRATA